jgi:pseudoazurin
MRYHHLLGAAVAALTLASPSLAAEHVVRMLNRGTTGPMAFEPAVVRIAPGDTVRFVPTNPSHNAESIPGMLPAGARPFRGAINREFSVRFTQPGVYGYKCLPHYGMGMVGLVIVGNPNGNLAAARRVVHPGRARTVFNSLFGNAAASGGR